MIKFILKTVKFIFILLIAFLLFTYLFSLKSNMSFQGTIEYFKTVSNKFLNNNNNNNSNEIILTSSNNHYYYNQLDDTSKIMYSALENNIDNLVKDNYIIDFSTTFNDLLNTAAGQHKLSKSFQSTLDAFFYDHPELFYLDLTNFSLNTKCISVSSLKTYTVEIIPKNNNYLRSTFASIKEVKAAINQVEYEKNTIINEVQNKNTYEQIKEVHDTLIKELKYNNINNSHNIYGALIQKQVVCEGYAKAFKYLMDELDIECILVSGIATTPSGNQESHMWNYVKLNNSWYGVDVTWDDPIVDKAYNKNTVRHDYFLKGKNVFLSSHDANGKISQKGNLFTIPTLSDTNYK